VYSDLVSGELLLKDIVDLNTMETVAHTYNGAHVHRQEQANGRSRIRLEPFDTTTEEGATARTAHLERELAAEREEVRALRHSRAYRLGDALLMPARRVRSMFNRRG
jgi:hypothetical protein